MKLREQIEKGKIILNPYPTSLLDYYGKYEQINIHNKKKGINILVTKYKRITEHDLPNEYFLEGDIPVKRECLDKVRKDIEKVAGCKIEYIHEHNEDVDLHPKCIYYNETFFIEGLSKLWNIANR